MSKVWLANDLRSHSPVIVKKIPYEYENEAKILQNLTHPDVPTLLDVIKTKNETYLIEKYIPGKNLSRFLSSSPIFNIDELCNYTRQLCNIIYYLHDPKRMILHLDIKPENILISKGNIKLIDFGSSIQALEDHFDSERIYGTPTFAAPEQINKGKLSVKTDIYALGKVMQYMFHHMIHYSSSTSSGYFNIINNCLRRGSYEYESAAEILPDLNEVQIYKKK